tara:strand:- start:518 stop:745 length:228 start_codon:yes stop_codon:yes gene_type:complete
LHCCGIALAAGGQSIVEELEMYRLSGIAFDLGELASNKGAQVYRVPADTDPTRFDKIVIYCRKYSVPLGIADLKR